MQREITLLILPNVNNSLSIINLNLNKMSKQHNTPFADDLKNHNTLLMLANTLPEKRTTWDEGARKIQLKQNRKQFKKQKQNG